MRFQFMRHRINVLGIALARLSQLSSSRQKFFCVGVSVLNHSFKGLMTFLVSPGLGQISANSHIFSQKHFAVVLQPVEDLFNILLKQPF